MGEEIKRTIKFTLVFMVLLGLVYPFVMTGIANLLFPYQAKGSIIKVDGKPVGSELIGQKFTDPRWFMGRPSAVDYDATSSGGTNYALSNPKFHEELEKNIEEFLKKNPGVKRSEIPADIVTSSGSGLDPHISPKAAYLQVKRVAKVNGLPEEVVKKLVDKNIEGRFLGLFGEPRVNVLKLNLSLLEEIKKHKK
ncbi:potassium-transporting ATPase subunit KdpC [Caldanaerobacter subterraneus]|uniref:Potassium-transporting ATPase KdpC subunit n=3 Tax=Caldanaerobacter subterraneus TaxID=911092 RepID=KDPC_CALS4|nr:potassium-transporting ATPase subunit KdpC [Caldanaerobacter subterraneus]Q8R8I7.1 RecName: Full=Potassium-transporting ATPase KdpC subunit; AltName: Full=ATP phosphohydrolase [potassium-transporting] C chain; AltName: Full=Potassium-binding and translocating subunit C; AltName: Full=Potassium-translocating ATPase C chain [Caldanaerobacter subterraneus subsp. tengcongensis MB4]AAM25188.1 K+-transporting ATPase, c chain [Caldanaerobacter subterraneus subsp. tengcongensis MB4]KKC29020.1 K+-tran